LQEKIYRIAPLGRLVKALAGVLVRTGLPPNVTNVKVPQSAGCAASVWTGELLGPIIPPPLTAVRNWPFGTLSVSWLFGQKLSVSRSQIPIVFASL
jgi:hypothetical protein